MKKSLIISLIILVLAASGITYLLLSDSGKQAKEDMVRRSDSQPNNDSPPTTGAPGNYINYNENIVAETGGTKLLFFHAPWCPQCRDLEADIKKDGVPSGVTIIKVDYDTNQGLRQKYGVTLQTTFVKIDDSGNLIEKFIAYDDPTLDSVKENLL